MDIAPYLHENPKEIYKALNVKSNSQEKPQYPLNAIEAVIKELEEESKLETYEEFEWEE